MFLLLTSIIGLCHIHGSVRGCVFQARRLELGAVTDSCSRVTASGSFSIHLCRILLQLKGVRFDQGKSDKMF